MLDAIDRRAEQEAVAMNNLRKYQTNTKHKPILHNNIARAGEIPATIIKRRISRRRVVKTTHNAKKQIPISKTYKVFSLGE